MAGQKYDALLLENQLCFPLYACSREIIKGYRGDLEALGLTYTQYIVLLVIWEAKSISVRDLGRRLYLDSGTLTPVLKTLEKMKLITRCRSTEDERVLVVSLTKEGEAMREEALDIPAHIDASIKPTADEKQTLYKLLYKALAGTAEA